MPLVDQEGHGNDEPPDVRFAIDDDDDVGGAYDAGDGDDNGQSSIRQQEEQERQPLHPQGRSSQDGWSGHVPAEEEASYKYPPAAPPPSYREATGKSLITHHVSKLCSSVSLPDLSILQRGISRIWIIICRFWPTSRFAQVGLFMMGLWLLVIVSGPVFDDAGPRAGAGYPWAGIDKVSNLQHVCDAHHLLLTPLTLLSLQLRPISCQRMGLDRFQAMGISLHTQTGR